MTRTVAEVLASAGATLNDVDMVAHPEAERIGYVVDGLNMARVKRPDLFMTTFGVSFGTLTAVSVLPLDEMYFRAIVDYVIARCETKEDEHVVSARAQLMASFAAGLLV